MLATVAVLLVVSVAALGLTISYDAACPTTAPSAATSSTIKAYRYSCYGSPTVLQMRDVGRPTPADSEVLVRIHAVSINPLDWHYMRGKPYLMRISLGIGAPENHKIGSDFAGTVEAVGAAVTRFKIGDRVFGSGDGTFAEFSTMNERDAIVMMPDSATFEEAAAVGIAAVTALQAVRDKGKVKAGQRVLINGASGGVGSFAVQIAKSYGAHVTGVASGRNIALVKSFGADSVIDYTKDDFTKGTQRFDVIIDLVSNHSVRAVAAVMPPSGICVIVGGTNDNRWIGPGIQSLEAMIVAPFVTPTFVSMLASMNQQELEVLRDLMQAGKVTSAIDRRYPMAELPAAVAYLEKGRARGKVIVNVVPSQ